MARWGELELSVHAREDALCGTGSGKSSAIADRKHETVRERPVFRITGSVTRTRIGWSGKKKLRDGV